MLDPNNRPGGDTLILTAKSANKKRFFNHEEHEEHEEHEGPKFLLVYFGPDVLVLQRHFSHIAHHRDTENAEALPYIPYLCASAPLW